MDTSPIQRCSICWTCHVVLSLDLSSVEDRAGAGIPSVSTAPSNTAIDSDTSPKEFVSLRAISDSARSGCGFCRMLELGLRLCIPNITDENPLKNPLCGLTIPEIRNGNRRTRAVFQPVWYNPVLSDGSDSYPIKFFTLPGHRKPHESMPIESRQIRSTGSEQAFEHIKNWIQNCMDSHSRCRRYSPAPTPLPSRVLDVGQGTLARETDVKLCELAGEFGDYICLSHCWGKYRSKRMTTRKRLEANKVAIPWTSFSRTFQDAIVLTRKLGVRYLWIDSFCIIQDDKKDWARESANMASIYENAYLTIAATKSSESTEGCFSVIDSQLLEYQLPDIFTDRDGNPVQIFVRRAVKRTTWSWSQLSHNAPLTPKPGLHPDIVTETLPLLHRGWVFQERILSNRMLHFTETEMMWECLEKTLCLCSCMTELHDEYTQNKERQRIALDIKSLLDIRFQDQDKLEFDWEEIVKNYTQLKLSFATDKLPALSGMAKRFQVRKPEDKYLAGLWLSSLLSGLQWHVVGRAAEPFGILRTGTVPSIKENLLCFSTGVSLVHDAEWSIKKLQNFAQRKAYIAPSWSWASSVYSVANYGSSTASDISRANPPKTRILEAECTASTLDPTGRVSSGYLLLQGPLLRAEFTYEQPEGFYWKWHYHRPKVRSQGSYSIFYPDWFLFAAEFRREPSVYLLWLDDERPACLVLRKAHSNGKDEENVFRRIGYCKWDGKMSVWGAAEDTIVRII